MKVQKNNESKKKENQFLMILQLQTLNSAYIKKITYNRDIIFLLNGFVTL